MIPSKINIQPSIEILTWQENAKLDEFSERAIKHLDLGSANYGPDTPSSEICPGGMEEYPDLSVDPRGEKKHRALFHLADHIIGSHPEKDTFLFYLLDISVAGLDCAAINLRNHLANMYRDTNLKIRIEKIFGSYFKMDSFPEVDSSSWLHPDYTVALSVLDSGQNAPRSRQLIKLLQKVSAVSRKGLLIKECNYSSNRLITQLTNKMTQPNRIAAKEKLNLTPESIDYIPRYIFPSGSIQWFWGQKPDCLSYRVTLAPPSSSKEGSISRRALEREGPSLKKPKTVKD